MFSPLYLLRLPHSFTRMPTFANGFSCCSISLGRHWNLTLLSANFLSYICAYHCHLPSLVEYYISSLPFYTGLFPLLLLRSSYAKAGIPPGYSFSLIFRSKSARKQGNRTINLDGDSRNPFSGH